MLHFLCYLNTFTFQWEQELAQELAQLLDDEWLIQINEGFLNLALLSTFENICVSRSISWNGHEANVFIHNKKLSKDSFVFKIPAPKVTEEVAGYLERLASLVSNCSICKGVQLYEEE